MSNDTNVTRVTAELVKVANPVVPPGPGEVLDGERQEKAARNTAPIGGYKPWHADGKTTTTEEALRLIESGEGVLVTAPKLAAQVIRGIAAQAALTADEWNEMRAPLDAHNRRLVAARAERCRAIIQRRQAAIREAVGDLRITVDLLLDSEEIAEIFAIPLNEAEAFSGITPTQYAPTRLWKAETVRRSVDRAVA
jgi:hypothetical protein